MDPEVLRDLLDRHTVVAVTGDPHDIIAELTGIGLRHSNILPARPQGKPSQMSPIGAADPSYRALTTEQQRFLRLIVLHASPQIMVDGAALLAAVSNNRSLKLLRQLRTAHLLEAGNRFHDLVREYAAEPASRDEERDAAMSRFYAGLSQQAVTRVRDFATTRQTAALHWFDRNHEELLRTAIGTNGIFRARLVIPLANALMEYQAIRGHQADFDKVVRLAVCTGINARELRAEINTRVVAAYHCLDHGWDEEAVTWFYSAWDQVRFSQEAELIEWILRGFVVALKRTGRHDAAAKAEWDLRLFQASS